MAHARTAAEGEIDQTEHVEGGHQRRDIANEPEHAIGAALGSPGLPENFIFGEKSGEGRDARDRQRGDEHRQISGGDAFAKIAHVAHVLFARHRMNHRARAEEEQGFEEGVGEDVEDGGGKCANTKRQEHVAELRDSGVSEDALDVVLHQTDRGGEDGGERADDGDGFHRCGR